MFCTIIKTGNLPLGKSLLSDQVETSTSNVWCVTCRHETTIKNFSGAVKANNLLLVGLCSECHGDVAKVIEIT